MKICSKCKIEKDDNQYYTYFHSTQNKYRTRNICFTCTAIQKKEYKQLVKQRKNLPKNNPNMKKCTVCHEWKDKEKDYYRSGMSYLNHCKECERERERKRRNIELAQTGGSDRYANNPNEYLDDFQREQVFMVMETLGWQFNGTTWFKPGIKEEDGTWHKVKPLIKPKQIRNPPKTRKLNMPKEVILEYREDGLTFRQIGQLYNVSATAIIHKLREDEKKRG